LTSCLFLHGHAAPSRNYIKQIDANSELKLGFLQNRTQDDSEPKTAVILKTEPKPNFKRPLHTPPIASNIKLGMHQL